jgi:hypothetical protein
VDCNDLTILTGEYARWASGAFDIELT